MQGQASTPRFHLRVIRQVDADQFEVVCKSCGSIGANCACTQQKTVFTSNLQTDSQPVEKEPDPLQGRQYIGGRYKILGLIGSGGMATVYKVKHEALDKIYAIKVLNPRAATEINVLRFDQEAKAVGQLHHHNLVAVHDYGVSEDGILYIVMEYLEGIGLGDEIQRLGSIDEDRAIDIFKQVCDGLAYAHGKGVIHRDLKPSNIMLVQDEHGNEIPKIVDFGIAKSQTIDKKLTQAGDVFGTPLYMSPEQCVGEPADARSDIYSLGCVIYEALSGRSPFDGGNAVKTILNHLHEEAMPLRKVCSNNISAATELIVASCLEREPERRVQSADALYVNLHRIQAGKKPLQAMLPKLKRFPRTVAFDVVLGICAITAMSTWSGGQDHVSIKIKTHSPSTIELPSINSPVDRLIELAQASLNRNAYRDAIQSSQRALFIADSDSGVSAMKRFQIYTYLAASYCGIHDYERASIFATRAEMLSGPAHVSRTLRNQLSWLKSLTDQKLERSRLMPTAP